VAVTPVIFSVIFVYPIPWHDDARLHGRASIVLWYGSPPVSMAWPPSITNCAPLLTVVWSCAWELHRVAPRIPKYPRYLRQLFRGSIDSNMPGSVPPDMARRAYKQPGSLRPNFLGVRITTLVCAWGRKSSAPNSGRGGTDFRGSAV